MTRGRLQALIDALIKLRDAADDELALDSIGAYASWKTGVKYSEDDRREYGGKLYRCVQGHTSQSDYTPDITPALWTEISLDEWPEWRQPEGSHNAYRFGAKVSHNGLHWESALDYNTYEPGVYGWNVVED